MLELITKEKFRESNLPGATTIITDVFGDSEFKDIPEKVLELACERGTKVHEYIEEFILNGEKPKIELEYQIYADYFHDWLEEYKPKFDKSNVELKLISEEYGFKGIIDVIYELDGKKVLCDWKTSSNLNLFKTSIQLNLYALLLKSNGFEVDELRVLSLTKQGYKFVNIPLDIELATSVLYIRSKKGGKKK